MTADRDRLVVWGAGTSRTMRVHWMLCELGLDYQTREIVPRTETLYDPAFVALSQRGKVPLLQHGDQLVGESAAIVFHLADHFAAEQALIPEVGTPERTRFTDLSFFVLTELDATSLYVVRRHQGLPEIYGEAPQAVATAKTYFLRQVEEMERALGSQQFLMGDSFSACDILLGSTLDWARGLGYPLADSLSGYQERCWQRPSYQTAWRTNFPEHVQAALGFELTAPFEPGH